MAKMSKQDREILQEARDAYERRFNNWKENVIIAAIFTGIFGIVAIISLGLLIAAL